MHGRLVALVRFDVVSAAVTRNMRSHSFMLLLIRWPIYSVASSLHWFGDAERAIATTKIKIPSFVVKV